MFNKIIIGSEKALLGALAGGSGTLISQMGVSNQMTLKEALYSFGVAVVTYIFVWVTTNTPKAPSLPPSTPPETSPTPVEATPPL